MTDQGTKREGQCCADCGDPLSHLHYHLTNGDILCSGCYWSSQRTRMAEETKERE